MKTQHNPLITVLVKVFIFTIKNKKAFNKALFNKKLLNTFTYNDNNDNKLIKVINISYIIFKLKKKPLNIKLVRKI